MTERGTTGAGVKSPSLGGPSRDSQVVGTSRCRTPDGVQASRPLARFRRSFAAPVLHGSAGLRVVRGGRNRLLTVRQVAEGLEVSTSTVYALIERGEIAHVRVSNAIRVAPTDLAAYLISGRRKGRPSPAPVGIPKAQPNRSRPARDAPVTERRRAP